MLAEMTSAQLSEWEIFYGIEPWGTEVEDLRAGVIAAAVANHAGRMLPDGEYRTPAFFFPALDRDRAPAAKKQGRHPKAERSRAAMEALAKRKRKAS